MHRLRSYIPSANYLFCFEAAARRRSFTAAAEELNVSQPAVSKTIRLLEEATGLQLFRREHTGLELTPEGQKLFAEVQESFDHLHMVISSMQRNRSGDVVRVSFSTSFVQLWLLPRLSDFRRKHPQIVLRIEESSRDDQDLAEENIDLSARLGHGRWPGIYAWKFVEEEILPVCSADYLQENADLTVPEAFLNQSLLHFEERYRNRLGWHEWFIRQGVHASKMKPDFIFTDALGSIKAASLGQGIALGWRHLVKDQLDAGQLVTPPVEPFRTGQSVYLIMPAQRPAKRGTEIFRDWMLDQMALSLGHEIPAE